MVRYIKCPRCELNYINADTQEYCDVCIAELKGNKLQFADLDDDELTEGLEEEATELCPVCGVNYMKFGETMCEECKAKSEYEEDADPDKDEEWKNYLDDDSEDLSIDDTELDDEELKEELEGDDEESEEEFFDEEEEDPLDDFDEDADFDDDDEDEDDEDDEDDDLF